VCGFKAFAFAARLLIIIDWNGLTTRQRRGMRNRASLVNVWSLQEKRIRLPKKHFGYLFRWPSNAAHSHLPQSMFFLPKLHGRKNLFTFTEQEFLSYHNVPRAIENVPRTAKSFSLFHAHKKRDFL